MDIEDYDFADDDVSVREAHSDMLKLNCDLPDIDGMGYIEIVKDDVIAMAIHFGVTDDDFQGWE